MQTRTLAPFALLLCSLSILPRSARAFGGTARELERQGNFAITNNAGFQFSHAFGHGDGTTFAIRPALDYFVVDNLSLGGAVEFDFASGNPDFTQFQLAPDIGFEVALSDTWSVWPSLSIPIAFPSHAQAQVAVQIFVPFLVHPAEHFFFGLGPGFFQILTSNPGPPPTQLIGLFSIGGYFDH